MRRYLLKDYRDFEGSTMVEYFRDGMSAYDVCYDFFGDFVDITKNENKVYVVISDRTKRHIGDIIEVDV